MSSLRRLAVLALPVALVGLSACSGSGSSDKPDSADEPITGIPQAWLDDTAEGWPESDGYGATTLMVGYGADCLTYQGEVEIAGATPKITSAGFGGFGAEETYRYVCNIHEKDHYAGDVQVINLGDVALAEQVRKNTMDDTDSAVQENDVSVVESGGTEIHVLTRWYPTNPQGKYIAVYLDEEAGALLSLEVNSLNEEDFEEYTEQDVADDLVALLRSA